LNNEANQLLSKLNDENQLKLLPDDLKTIQGWFGGRFSDLIRVENWKTVVSCENEVAAKTDNLLALLKKHSSDWTDAQLIQTFKILLMEPHCISERQLSLQTNMSHPAIEYLVSNKYLSIRARRTEDLDIQSTDWVNIITYYSPKVLAAAKLLSTTDLALRLTIKYYPNEVGKMITLNYFTISALHNEIASLLKINSNIIKTAMKGNVTLVKDEALMELNHGDIIQYELALRLKIKCYPNGEVEKMIILEYFTISALHDKIASSLKINSNKIKRVMKGDVILEKDEDLMELNHEDIIQYELALRLKIKYYPNGELERMITLNYFTISALHDKIASSLKINSNEIKMVMKGNLILENDEDLMELNHGEIIRYELVHYNILVDFFQACISFFRH